MELARVEGKIVATIKSDRLKGRKLTLINLIGPDTQPSNSYLVAIDPLGAGVGEIVLAVRGSSARQSDDLGSVPTDASIVAIVDTIELEGKMVYRKDGPAAKGVKK
ncbi:EutN/CcmL family microcompartment protein [candidate division KSB1 bacterium]|nr:EutN/CcmL family microcompartment protein [candidate division KSB1 bacterium]